MKYFEETSAVVNVSNMITIICKASSISLAGTHDPLSWSILGGGVSYIIILERSCVFVVLKLHIIDFFYEGGQFNW